MYNTGTQSTRVLLIVLEYSSTRQTDTGSKLSEDSRGLPGFACMVLLAVRMRYAFGDYYS